MNEAERLLVMLCTYNERENLAALIPEIWTFAPAAEILVIDDNSPDGTGRLADEWAARDGRVHVLHRPAVLPVPSLGPRLLLGAQGARELACASQRVIPDRLSHSGHRFRQPDLDRALRHLLGRTAA